MGEPSQVQTGVGKFLEKFLSGVTGGTQEAVAGEEKKAAQGKYFDAMSALKDKELGAKWDEDMMSPEEATRLAGEGKAPYHFTVPVHRTTFAQMMTDWGAQHTPRARGEGGDKRPRFDMGTAQNQALAAARATLGKENQALPYAELPAALVPGFNTAYRLHLDNAISNFERLNGRSTGVKARDYIRPGQDRSFPYGIANFGAAGQPNTIEAGYEEMAPPPAAPPAAHVPGPAAVPRVAAPPPPVAGRPLDQAAKTRILQVRQSHKMSDDQMATFLTQAGYQTSPAEVAAVR